MGLKMKVKSYSFWVSLASAIILILKLVGQKFGFSVDEGLISDLFTSLCAILVILGIIVVPSTNSIGVVQTENKTNFEEKMQNQNEKLEEKICEKVEKFEEVIETINSQVDKVCDFEKKDECLEVVEEKNESYENLEGVKIALEKEIVLQEENAEVKIEETEKIEPENKKVDIQRFIDKLCLNRTELNLSSDKFVEFLQSEIQEIKGN